MNYQTIIRYLENNCTTREAEQVESWLVADAENQRVYEEIKFFWHTSAKLPDVNSPSQGFNAREDWESLLNSIEMDTPQQPGIINQNKKDGTGKIGWNNRYSRPSKRSNFTQLARIAVLILISACIGIFTLQYASETPPEEEVAYREMVMEKGQRANIVFSDGTYMTLNADSKVRFPEKFSGNLREIFLMEGEAYFEVTENPEKPFLINVNGTVVRVLGTSFAVRSYPEDEIVRVVVKEGAVQFSSDTVHSAEKNESNSESIILSDKQIGFFDIRKKKLTSGLAKDLDLYLSWTQGYLKFRETPMEEVAQQLERKYNIDVEFASPDLKELQLTGEFRSREIQNVLMVIKGSLNLDFQEIDQQKIVFIRR